MIQKLGLIAVPTVVMALGLAPAAGVAEEASVVAIVDGTPITAEALDDVIQSELIALRHREDQLRRQGLSNLIAEVLLAREAQERGVSVEELTRIEIKDKARVTPAEARAFYEANRARFGGSDEATAIQQIVEGLGRQRERERRAVFARELRSRYPVEVRLEPFRVEVETGAAPLRGNPEAPVTIVEFSDFQCPYCVHARPIVNRVREVYGDQVRYAFRHFPLAFHGQAEKAGEAAACAGDQGRFWDMHDRLWKNQSKLTVPDLKQHAGALGLDTAAFAQCLDSGRHAALVKSDTEAGERLGVTGTPAFFINGRAILGAQSFEAFAQVIDDELKRAGRTPTKASLAP
ncbi:MAG: thioredoxin domain-containing protein [Acidobacteriota bacterium]|jgi:predicted DsbA family dithiol-disulfide isomerase